MIELLAMIVIGQALGEEPTVSCDFEPLPFVVAFRPLKGTDLAQDQIIIPREFEVRRVAAADADSKLKAAITRVPPANFDQCFSRPYSDLESVKVGYDIAPDGTTANLTVIETTNSCLSASAVWAIRDWRYEPPCDGEPLAVTGMVTTIEYDFEE